MSSYFKALGKVISSVKPNVPKTKIDKAKSKLNKAIQKTKGSKAKLSQTLFEIENKMPLTFKKKTGKSMKESDRKKQIMKDNSKVISSMFKKVLKDKK